MNDRLLLFVKRKNLTSAKLAEILEVQSSSISHILGGRNKPSYDFIAKFLDKFPDVSPQWLILGKGEMIIDDQPKIVSSQSNYSLFDNLVPVQKNSVMEPKSAPTPEYKFDSEDQVVDTVSSKSKPIDRIIIFYKDKSFSEYTPE